MRWFEDCRRVLKSFASFTSPGRLTCDLGPEDFEGYRRRLTQRGLTGKRAMGPCALNRAITVIKGMFKYAYDNDLIGRPMKYGHGFKKPSATMIRKSRRASERVNGKPLFTANDIRALFKAAPAPLNAMILLGINGGFGNTDCARLPLAAINWDKRIIEFERPKTGLERVVPLWPETIEALQMAVAERPEPVGEEASGLLFLTRFGRGWVRDRVHEADQGVEKIVTVDAIGQQFDRLQKSLDLKRLRRGFYALRHTFRTWADETRDQHAILRIMGHAIPGMSGVYIEEISLERLRAVVDHVHDRLFAGSNEGNEGAAYDGEGLTR